MNRIWLVTVLGAALGPACADQATEPPTSLNLNRPVDIAFACYGDMRVTGGRTTADPADPIIPTAQPALSCETQSPQLTPAPEMSAPPPMGQEGLDRVPSWYGFILQSATGTVAVAQFPAKPADQIVSGSTGTVSGDVKVIDADPLTPGKNAISVGEEPVAIATDQSGCYEVTANAGSCDLSVLDINSALDGDPSTQVRVDRLAVTNTMGPILARPAAMVVEPNTTDVGKACGPTASGVVYIAYPSCHLVAAVDMSDGMKGKVVAGIQYDAAGKATLLDTAALDVLTCPDECTNAMGTLDHGPIIAGGRPVALDLKIDGTKSRLVIGADNLPSVTVVELDPMTSLPLLPQVPTQIPLQETKPGTLGITAIALSPQIAMGGTQAKETMPPGGQGQYVYAVATDNTVRVVDVLNVNKECDTQVDTRFVRNIIDIPTLQCFPVGDPATPPRRSGAKGPGIELVGDAIPTSVAIIKGLDGPLLGPPDAGGKQNEIPPVATTLIGYFAIITASNGQSFVVNVDNDYGPDQFNNSTPLSTAPTLVMAHQLRDGINSRDNAGANCSALEPSDPATGGPRATAAPARSVPASTIASNKAAELPLLRQFACNVPATMDTEAINKPISEVQLGAPAGDRDQVFPDLRNVFNETWKMTWEGTLSLDGANAAVDGPQVRTGTMKSDSSGMQLIDQSRPFCEMGVEPFDIVEFRGCNPANGNNDCPSGYECYIHPESQVKGIGSCMLANEANRLMTACHDFLTTLRRYTVLRADSDKLVLLPRKHELTTTPLDGCIDDQQCEKLADYAAQLRATDDPIRQQDPLTGTFDPHTWACKTDTARAPIDPDPLKNKRCIETCTSSADCDVGTICQADPPGPSVCMEGVTPPQSCVNGPQQFAVRASEAFTVIGSRSGYIHPIIEQGGQCVRDPAANLLQIGRIPLKAPACDLAADPIIGGLPNPCSLLKVPEAEDQLIYPNFDASTKTCGTPTSALVQRDAPSIKFRNRSMTLTLVDPYYPGDNACVLDRQGTLGQIPVVVQDYQITFTLKAGFTPLTLPGIAPVYPVKVVRGPSDSIWVIDDGDFLSTSVGVSSTRGQVYRVEAGDLSTINLLQ